MRPERSCRSGEFVFVPGRSRTPPLARAEGRRACRASAEWRRAEGRGGIADRHEAGQRRVASQPQAAVCSQGSGRSGQSLGAARRMRPACERRAPRRRNWAASGEVVFGHCSIKRRVFLERCTSVQRTPDAVRYGCAASCRKCVCFTDDPDLPRQQGSRTRRRQRPNLTRHAARNTGRRSTASE